MLWHVATALCEKPLHTVRNQEVEFLYTVKVDKRASITKKGIACINEQSCYSATLYAKELPQCLYLLKCSGLLSMLICTSTGCGARTGVGLLGTTHNWGLFSRLTGCWVGTCQGRLIFAWETIESFLHGAKDVHWQTERSAVTLHYIMSYIFLCCGLLRSPAQSRLQFLLEATS